MIYFSLLLPVVLLFGLIHGLGFATVLNAAQIPPGERVLALTGFNLGVEVGQLLFIVALLAVHAVLRQMRVAELLERPLLLVAGAIGSFWTLERVAGFALPAI